MRKTICTLCCAITLSAMMIAQDDDRVYPVAEYMPAIKGCEAENDHQARRNCTSEKLITHLTKALKYPGQAKDAGQEGVAIVKFVVGKNGKVRDYTVEGETGYGLDQAALKAVKKLEGKWVPGTIKGEEVSVRMTVPVQFRLPKEVPTSSAAPEPDVYEMVDEMPRFAGCADVAAADAQNCSFEKLVAFMMANMKYPAEAKEGKVQGTVITQFVVNKEGAITQASVVEGLGSGCDAEALRVLGAMPAWIPGKHQGKTVKVQMTLPFRFALGKQEDPE